MAIEPQNIDKQIEILKGNGLIIENDIEAYSILSYCNYYRLKGYFHSFQGVDDKFKEGTSLNQILSIYKFDSQFRAIVFNLLEHVEISVKSSLALSLTNKEGVIYDAYVLYNDDIYEKDYTTDYSVMNTDDFHAIRRLQNVFKNFDEKYVKNHQHDPVIKRYTKNGICRLPAWAFVDFLTFGDVATIYSSLKKSEFNTINQTNYLLDNKHGASFFRSWLKSMTKLRNRCTHHERIYKYKNYESPPKILEYDDFTLFFPNHRKYNNSYFYIIVVAFFLVNDTKFCDSIINRFDALISNNNEVNIFTDYNFPSDWKSILNSSKAFLVAHSL